RNSAILLVEFADRARVNGKERRTAVLEACGLRFRPILMTSVAFILGVVPLLVGTGAGAEMRKALGTAVFGGMIGVTLFGIVLTPVFFVVVDFLAHSRAFASKTATTISRAAMWVLTLKFLRPVLRRATAWRPARPAGS